MTEMKMDVVRDMLNALAVAQASGVAFGNDSPRQFAKRYAAAPAEMVKVPKAVAEAVEWFQQNDENLGTVFRNAYEDMDDDWDEVPQLCTAETWIIEHPNEFAKAWVEWPSVEVEK